MGLKMSNFWQLRSVVVLGESGHSIVVGVARLQEDFNLRMTSRRPALIANASLIATLSSLFSILTPVFAVHSRSVQLCRILDWFPRMF